MAGLTCDRLCGPKTRQGFTNRGTADNPWWVCGTCSRPTVAWITSLGEDMLNYFVGGPMDNKAYTTKELLTAPHAGGPEVPIELYAWTPETITSGSTGRVARVWKQKSEVPGTVASAGKPKVVRPTSRQGVTKNMSTETTEPTTENTEAAADTTPEVPLDGKDLLNRRTSLSPKVSRAKLADLVGTTQAKIWRIENAGKRTTQAEVDEVDVVLSQLEKDAAEAAEAAANAPAETPAEENTEATAADPS